MQQGFVPCKDDKPKDAEITLFQAGSNYSLSVMFSGILQIPHMTVGSAIVLPIMLAAGFAAERGVALWKPLRS